MLDRLKLFFSLERYAFLILFLELVAIGIEFVVWHYFGKYALIYTYPHIAFALYWGYRMVKLFVEWPRKRRYHIATVNYYNWCNSKNLPIKKSKLYNMNSPCDKVTRDEICKNLDIKL